MAGKVLESLVSFDPSFVASPSFRVTFLDGLWEKFPFFYSLMVPFASKTEGEGK